MERYEIDAAVLSMGGALEASSAGAEPDRFGALAIVPFTAAGPDAAAAEIEYALDTLGLDGVALFSNHAGSYLGDPAWDVVFAELDRRGAYAFAHLGGASPFLAHRIASLEDREPQKAALAPAGALEYLRRQYYGTGLSNNLAALASTLAVTTLDRIVFGSDWPYLALPPGTDPSEDFDRLDPADRAKIDGGNVGALVPRLAGAGSGQPVVVDSQRHGGCLQ
jgi:predicted TIM-barrel fold metal-dependent hydrolase